MENDAYLDEELDLLFGDNGGHFDKAHLYAITGVVLSSPIWIPGIIAYVMYNKFNGQEPKDCKQAEAEQLTWAMWPISLAHTASNKITNWRMTAEQRKRKELVEKVRQLEDELEEYIGTSMWDDSIGSQMVSKLSKAKDELTRLG